MNKYLFIGGPVDGSMREIRKLYLKQTVYVWVKYNEPQLKVTYYPIFAKDHSVMYYRFKDTPIKEAGELYIKYSSSL